MPPTVCLAEFPTAGSTVNAYVCRRQRLQNGANIKLQMLALDQTLRTGIIGETLLTSRIISSLKLECTNTIPECHVIDKSERFSINANEHYRKLVTARKGTTIVSKVILSFFNKLADKMS